MRVEMRRGVGSEHSASKGLQAVKEGLSSLSEDNVGGSEGTLSMWVAVFPQSLPPHSNHLIKMWRKLKRI